MCHTAQNVRHYIYSASSCVFLKTKSSTLTHCSAVSHNFNDLYAYLSSLVIIAAGIFISMLVPSINTMPLRSCHYLLMCVPRLQLFSDSRYLIFGPQIFENHSGKIRTSKLVLYCLLYFFRTSEFVFRADFGAIGLFCVESRCASYIHVETQKRSKVG